MVMPPVFLAFLQRPSLKKNETPVNLPIMIIITLIIIPQNNIL